MCKYSGWLFAWFHERAPQVELNPDDNFFNMGAIDSLGVIELIEAMERAFAVRFTQDDFQDRRFSSVSGLAAMLAEKEGH